MKVHWRNTSSGLSICVLAQGTNTRQSRRYSLSPSYQWEPVHLVATWIGGGKLTTYGLRDSNNNVVGHQGWRTMAEVVDFASEYFVQ